MPTTLGPQAVPVPQPTDAPDGPGAFLALIQKMVVGGIIPYTTFLALPATGFIGQYASVTADPNPSKNGIYAYTASGWAPLTGGTVRFKGSYLTSTAVAANAVLKYPVVEDTMSAYSVSTGLFTAPFAGTYLVMVQSKQNSGAVAYSMLLKKNGSTIANTPNVQAATFTGAGINCYVPLAVGDTLSVQNGAAAWTTQSDTPADNNYLEIILL